MHDLPIWVLWPNMIAVEISSGLAVPFGKMRSAGFFYRMLGATPAVATWPGLDERNWLALQLHRW